MSHEFDFLTKWAAKPDEELVAEINPGNLEIMRKVVALIAPDEGKTVDAENFVELIRTMRIRYRRGARGLGDAIIQASDFTDKGDTEKAREVYESFIAKADSEFHAQIARNCLSRL